MISATTTVTSLVLALFAVTSSTAQATTLKTRGAQVAVAVAARDIATPFTERQPIIGTRCWHTGPNNARCRVHIRGDRIDMRCNATVAYDATDDSYVVRFGKPAVG
jgi:hypothetical protein